jgi:transcription elongation GreA/GreB family factor
MEKSQGDQAVTPVSIPPDPYQRALKDLRLAREELREANERIKRLEDIINRASLAFFSDASHRKVSIAMHTILEEFTRETKS